VGRRRADDGAPDRSAHDRSAHERGDLGWPGPPPDGDGLGWPAEDSAEAAASAEEPAPAVRRGGWRRLFGASAA
jgi:hypothetical protein